MASVLDRFRLDGKVALVTGGARGLGQVISEALASAGAQVALVVRRKEQAEGMAGAIRVGSRHGGSGSRGRCDPAADVEAMVAATLDRFGRIDILVNNAGVNIRGPIEHLTEDDWDLVVDTNLKGPWLCCRAVAEPMKRQKWGRVINVSSMMGEISMPDRTPYCVEQGGADPADQDAGPGMGEPRHQRQRPLPGSVRHRDQHAAAERPGRPSPDAGQRPAGPLGRPRRARPRRRLPRLRGLQLHDRRHAVHRRRVHGTLRASEPACSAIPLTSVFGYQPV